MNNVMKYSNYRLYMRDYYAERKERSGFTWRDFSKAAGYSSPVFLKLVCDGKSNLSEVGVERVAAAMGLVGVDLLYFRLLVSFNQEKNAKAQKEIFAQMRSLAKENEVELVGENQYDYFASWRNPVLRELAPKMKGLPPSKMAEQFAFQTSADDVKKALEVLQRVGMLEKDGCGNFVQVNKGVTTGNLDVTSLAVRDMHRQMGELAVQSLDEVPRDERDISGLTMGISESAFYKITKEIEDFRRRVTAIVMESSGEERVYRMNVQLFPLTKAKSEKGGENA